MVFTLLTLWKRVNWDPFGGYVNSTLLLSNTGFQWVKICSMTGYTYISFCKDNSVFYNTLQASALCRFLNAKAIIKPGPTCVMWSDEDNITVMYLSFWTSQWKRLGEVIDILTRATCCYIRVRSTSVGIMKPLGPHKLLWCNCWISCNVTINNSNYLGCTQTAEFKSKSLLIFLNMLN